MKGLLENWKREEEKTFEGWDFSYLDGRWEEEALPWDYRKIVKNLLKDEDMLLDMGTGGGEFLLSLNHPYERTSATEGWEPNYRYCLKKLAPLGIEVKKVDDDTLPFPQEKFDIVINRQDSFDVSEIRRVLKPGGVFITQQVGDMNNHDLAKFINEDYNTDFQENNQKSVSKDLKDNGFRIVKAHEYFPYVRFFDVGAFVYFAKIIQWEFPGFSVEEHFHKLLQMEEMLKKKAYIQGREHRFMLVAVKEE